MNSNELRNRQIREILDEDIGIYKQVIDRQFKSVGAYKESVSLKKERDIEAEVSIEKIVQQLQLKLQREVQQVEYLLSASEQRWDERKNDKDIDNVYNMTGEILTLYNTAMRLYLKVGLSKDSQESIKIKMMQLNPALNASLQALESIVDFMFSNGYVDNKLFWVFNTKSILQTIKDQIDDSRFKIIDNSDVMATFKNLAGLQSQERIQILKGLMSSTTPLKIRTFFNYPVDDYNLMNKLEQLEAEMGVDFSNLKKNINKVPFQKAQLMIDEAQKLIPLRKAAAQRQSELEFEISNKARELDDIDDYKKLIDAAFKAASDDFKLIKTRQQELNDRVTAESAKYGEWLKAKDNIQKIDAELDTVKSTKQLDKLRERRRALKEIIDADPDIVERQPLITAAYDEFLVELEEKRLVLVNAEKEKSDAEREKQTLFKEYTELNAELKELKKYVSISKDKVDNLAEEMEDVITPNLLSSKRLKAPPSSLTEEKLSKEQGIYLNPSSTIDMDEDDDDEKAASAADAEVDYLEKYGNGRKNKKLHFKDGRNDIYKFMVKNKALLVK